MLIEEILSAPSMLVTEIKKSSMLNIDSGIATTTIVLVVEAIAMLVLVTVAISVLTATEIEISASMET